jgi:hypothetical protein
MEVRGELVGSIRNRGDQPTVPEPAPQAGVGHDGIAKFADRITKWIPGDALALYLPGVAYFANPNPWWLAIMTVVAGLLVIGSVFATGEKIRREVWAAALLATIAFLIWSLSIPSSGWHAIPAVRTHKFIVSLAGAVSGSLFALVAEGVTRRMIRRTAE